MAAKTVVLSDVPLKTYDETIGMLRRSLDSAKLRRMEKIDGFRRWDGFVRAIEQSNVPRANFDATIARERMIVCLSGRQERTRRGPKTEAYNWFRQVSLF